MTKLTPNKSGTKKKLAEPNIDSVLDLFEAPLVSYVIGLMERAGMPINRDGAENILSNVGVRILKRKISK